MEKKDYFESVSSIPIFERGPPIGPIENGTTYIVRPESMTSNSFKIITDEG